jgi:broad specificity phosphatase PhoE
MPADVLRFFVFARHAESAANAADVLNTNPSQPVALTARGRTQARALGAQLAGLHVDLPVGTRPRPGRPAGAHPDRTRLR